jgi:hypothetical protein
MTVSYLTEGLCLIEARVWVTVETDSNDQRAATHSQRIRKMPAYDDEMLMEKKWSLRRQTSALDS